MTAEGEPAWSEAFEAVVLQAVRGDKPSRVAWKRYVDQGDLDAVRVPGRRGQLTSADDDRTALWTAFRYQRCHADAFKSALRRSRYRYPKIDRVVLDFGCGAGTVAFAFSELIDEVGSPVALSYVGVDHNEPIVQLSRSHLAHPAMQADQRTFDAFATIGAATDLVRSDIEKGFRPFLTMSYLLRQESVDSDALDSISEAIVTTVRAAVRAGIKAVPLVITDSVGGPTSRFPALYDRLSEHLNVAGSRTPDAFSKPLRFPNLYPHDEGWYRVIHNRYNNVERWRLDLSG